MASLIDFSPLGNIDIGGQFARGMESGNKRRLADLLEQRQAEEYAYQQQQRAQQAQQRAEQEAFIKSIPGLMASKVDSTARMRVGQRDSQGDMTSTQDYDVPLRVAEAMQSNTNPDVSVGFVGANSRVTPGLSTQEIGQRMMGVPGLFAQGWDAQTAFEQAKAKAVETKAMKEAEISARLAQAGEQRQFMAMQGEANRQNALALAGMKSPSMEVKTVVDTNSPTGYSYLDMRTKAITPNAPPPAGSTGIGSGKMNKFDEGQLKDVMKAANAAENLDRMYSQAEALYGKYKTDKYEPIQGAVARWNPLADPNRVKDFETATQLSSDFGIAKLELIGGSDTERELKTAIETAPSPDKKTGTNLEIIAKGRLATSILMDKGDFAQQWIQKTGSLMNKDPDSKKTYSAAWREYQKSKWDSGLKSIVGGDGGVATPQAPQNAKGVVPVKSDAEAESLPKGTRFILNGRTGTVQ